MHDAASQKSTTAIAGLHVAKRFGHVQALTDASVTVGAGEVVALVGDNGAGKSTFLKTLLGLIVPDEGEFIVGDQPVHFTSIRDAQAAGVEAVHQDLSLAPDLSVVDNMFLGHEVFTRGILGKLGVIARKEMTERADVALRELSIKLPSLKVDVSDLSGGQKQGVAVARAVMWGHTAILMDEPTAALGARQSEIVCELMRTVAARGLGVLVVSHDLPRILKVADRVTVLWRGSTVMDAPASGLTVPDVVATMVGFGKEQAA
ncbi:monosaccharide ABC transporter ATP-binding protein (CUT2 family) [Homoserinimonas aerilata]|uniref:Monosaccharide ABC transporter ATP-binding protein (CUT2 family) n=1 Tax=Homoserinimonas aerilata TaxID=1162970 RepID=A0A542YLA3_9MICO|nr:ATP-binding cassette domain-containing protein [Homoserinimonas aerilata]TQL48848.1 monosaccharide ABC transporter ATP-binding protein (CUT2 family) [Homoserinimonas aerilata]